MRCCFIGISPVHVFLHTVQVSRIWLLTVSLNTSPLSVASATSGKTEKGQKKKQKRDESSPAAIVIIIYINIIIYLIQSIIMKSHIKGLGMVCYIGYGRRPYMDMRGRGKQ